MGYQASWRTICDQCGAKGPIRIHSYQADDAAEKVGWLIWVVFYGTFHACPECRQNLNKDLAASLENALAK